MRDVSSKGKGVNLRERDEVRRKDVCVIEPELESEYRRASEYDSKVGSILIPSNGVYMGLYMYEISRDKAS